MTKITSKKAEKEEIQEKDKYRVTNWSSYNKALVGRGDITIWIDEAVVTSWYYQGPDQKGAQYVYSDECIACLLGIKVVFKLPYRQLQGFAGSFIQLMGFDIIMPSYTQICRRASDLEVNIEAPISKAPIYVVIDSTGLKVYGEGEWKTRKHGVSKRRTWRKLHLGVDEKTGFIHAQVLTENGKGDGDAQQVKDMLGQIKSPVDKFSGDGAYDAYEIWELLKEEKIEGIIPPQENAVYWVDEFDNLLDCNMSYSLLFHIQKQLFHKI